MGQIVGSSGGATIGDEGGKRDPQTYAIIGAAMTVHRALGSHFLEGVYQAALGVEFDAVGVPFRSEVTLPIYYRNKLLNAHYRLERLTPREDSQMINYLAASHLQRALLLTFGSPSLEFKRFVGPRHTPTTTSVSSVKSVGPMS